MCGAPANTTGWIDPGTLNYVTLEGLMTSTKYYYVYGDPSFGYSAEFSFMTGPVVGPNSSVLVLANADPVRTRRAWSCAVLCIHICIAGHQLRLCLTWQADTGACAISVI